MNAVSTPPGSDDGAGGEHGPGTSPRLRVRARGADLGLRLGGFRAPSSVYWTAPVAPTRGS